MYQLKLHLFKFHEELIPLWRALAAMEHSFAMRWKAEETEAWRRNKQTSRKVFPLSERWFFGIRSFPMYVKIYLWLYTFTWKITINPIYRELRFKFWCNKVCLSSKVFFLARLNRKFNFKSGAKDSRVFRRFHSELSSWISNENVGKSWNWKKRRRRPTKRQRSLRVFPWTKLW